MVIIIVQTINELFSYKITLAIGYFSIIEGVGGRGQIQKNL